MFIRFGRTTNYDDDKWLITFQFNVHDVGHEIKTLIDLDIHVIYLIL